MQRLMVFWNLYMANAIVFREITKFCKSFVYSSAAFVIYGKLFAAVQLTRVIPSQGYVIVTIVQRFVL